MIDAGGKTLLPGLWDMHVHLSESDGLFNLAAGVTSVRDMANDIDQLLDMRRRWETGEGIGPRVLMAGFIDGPGPYAGPTKVLVSTEQQALEWVDRYAKLGYVQIKIYSSLDPKLVPPIVKRAHAAGPAGLRPHPQRHERRAGGARRVRRDPARQLPDPQLPRSEDRHPHPGPLRRGGQARRPSSTSIPSG